MRNPGKSTSTLWLPQNQLVVWNVTPLSFNPHLLYRLTRASAFSEWATSSNPLHTCFPYCAIDLFSLLSSLFSSNCKSHFMHYFLWGAFSANGAYSLKMTSPCLYIFDGIPALYYNLFFHGFISTILYAFVKDHRFSFLSLWDYSKNTVNGW